LWGELIHFTFIPVIFQCALSIKSLCAPKRKVFFESQGTPGRNGNFSFREEAQKSCLHKKVIDYFIEQREREREEAKKLR
jgi:hypothetical protein